jgi:hypothetical protein
MDVGVIIEGISAGEVARQPWIFHREALAERNIRIHVYAGDDPAGFQRPFDAMIVHAWQDWKNPKRFDRTRIMPLLERYATYRAAFRRRCKSSTMSTWAAVLATPYWRTGDPVLYKTPAYDRREWRVPGYDLGL